MNAGSRERREDLVAREVLYLQGLRCKFLRQ